MVAGEATSKTEFHWVKLCFQVHTSNSSAVRALIDDGCDSITSAADAGGKNPMGGSQRSCFAFDGGKVGKV